MALFVAPMLNTIDSCLKQRKELLQYRSLSIIEERCNGTVRQGSNIRIDFSSNDSLGLSGHPLLKQKAIQYTQDYGCGASASRLITANLSYFPHLEQKIASMKGTESALILNSGYQANITLLQALISRKSYVFADRLCHQSLLAGVQLGGGRLLRYRHNDYAHLKLLLSRYADQPDKMIITESLFGMDGDCVDLEELIKIKQRYDALLYIDEAHATGILGPQGKGLAAHRTEVDVVMGTFSKAFGSFGAYVACSQKMKDYFINCCGGFIYSTALPPPVLGAIDAALDLVPTMDLERSDLLRKAAYLRQRLQENGWDCGASCAHIIPILVGDEKKALHLSEHLMGKGLFIYAIRPPTVPFGQSRLRISLSARHTQEHLDTLVQALGKSTS